MKDLIIIGCGGHALACIDVIHSTKNFNVIGFVDNQSREDWHNLKWLGTDADLPELVKSCSNYFIGVGQIKDSTIRRKIYTNIINLIDAKEIQQHQQLLEQH